MTASPFPDQRPATTIVLNLQQLGVAVWLPTSPSDFALDAPRADKTSGCQQ